MFGPDSKVLRSRHANFLESVVEQGLSQERKPGSFALLKPMRLSRIRFGEMLKELSAIVDKYAYLSEHPAGRGGGEI